MLIPLLLFLAGLALLVKGADLFVDGARDLAARHGISSSVIGFTIVAFGTSLPELAVTVGAVGTGRSDIGLGNVLGSNIANLGLILAIVAAIRPDLMTMNLTRDLLNREALLMLLSTGIYALLSLRGVIDPSAGLVMLAGFGLILFRLGTAGREEAASMDSHWVMDWALIMAGIGGVVGGSMLLLEGAVSIATSLGIPAYVIGLSMVAVGTSIPELATSVVAILRGETGISIGNLLGSNIFNILFILGCSALIAPIPVQSISDTLFVVLFAFVILPLFSFSPRPVRWWAAGILVAYASYILQLYGIL